MIEARIKNCVELSDWLSCEQEHLERQRVAAQEIVRELEGTKKAIEASKVTGTETSNAIGTDVSKGNKQTTKVKGSSKEKKNSNSKGKARADERAPLGRIQNTTVCPPSLCRMVTITLITLLIGVHIQCLG